MNKLCFYLNGNYTELDFSLPESPSPFCSVVHYLRHILHLTGTKEVCSKGDCGACTVLLASAGNEDTPPLIQSMDSCLLRLADLHGKHLLTIEAPSELLNIQPIKEAFLKQGASQCGFCSPAMVLSTYAHIANGLPFTRESICRSLSGNLCRCTGYQAIYDAFVSLENIHLEAKPLPFPYMENQPIEFVKGSLRFCKPNNLTSLQQMIQSYPDAHVVAGLTGAGLSLMDKTEDTTVLDISQIKELNGIHQTDKGLFVGAACPIEKWRDYCEHKSIYASLANYLEQFASLQVRNKATLGGSIADGSPVGDIMPLCMAMDGTLELLGPQGTRIVKADDFTLYYRKVDLKKGELIAQLFFPKPTLETQWFFHKQSRRKNMDISTVSFASSVQIKDGKCMSARLVYGGMAATVAHAKAVESYLIGKKWNLSTVKKAALLIDKDFHALSDVRSGCDYRMEVAKNILIMLYNGNK